MSTDVSPQRVPQCTTHQASGSTEESLNVLHDFVTQTALKRKRELETALEADLAHERTNNHDIASDADNGNGSSNSDAPKASWIGRMVQEPPGERGRGTNAHGRLGFNNSDILRLTGITQRKWGLYLVSDISIPYRILLLIRYSLLHIASLTTTGISRRIGQQTPRARITVFHGN